jgi:Protein of unknown function (DUF2924)
MLASGRFRAAVASETTDRETETSNPRSPDWQINRRTICGLPGANCIVTNRRTASVAICSSEPSSASYRERNYGGASRALRRRLQTLSAELEKGAACSDSGIMLKTGTTLLRLWRGHTHSILVGEDGFEYEGRRYRSLTVIAERITGAHWSGPRFFGLTRRAGASVAEAGR